MAARHRPARSRMIQPHHGPLHPRVLDLLRRAVHCGDPHFGFLRLRCECGEERLIPFSCKTRGLCPSCGTLRALAWAERMVEDVLPDVPYVSLVFTTPKMLRKHFLFARSLYGVLCRVAYEVVRAFLAEHFPKVKRAVPAMVAAPQSWGTLLNFHPHAHALASLGVFDQDGVFHGAPFDLVCAPIEEPFRERMLDRLHTLGKIDDARVALLRF